MTTKAQTVDPVPPVDPAVIANAVPPAADPPVVDPAAPSVDPTSIDPPPAVADPVDPKPHGNKGRKPWYLDRISEESEARRQAEARTEELRQQLERAAADPSTTTARTVDEQAIETRARQIAQETVNGDKIRSVVQAGVGAFPDWDDRMGVLGAAGAASPEFALDIHSVDPANAHAILYALSDDPQKASRLAKMDTRSRTIELVKMSLAAQGKPVAAQPTERQVLPAPKTPSRAPAPPPPVEPGATQTIDWRTDPNISDQEFSKKWDENAKQRAALRR